MKKIDAIIRQHRLPEVVTRLRLIGVQGMTIAEVHGISRSTEVMGVFRGERYRMPSAPRYQVTVVVGDDLASPVVAAIIHAARTDEAGDGIIAVGDVVDVIRIRTGESGPGVL
jgi:nitrogen regulatory protein P-II 1